MIVDANVLLYAVDSSSRHHESAERWLTNALNGDVRVGLPYQSLFAFTRIATHPRINEQPLNGEEAWEIASSWIDAEVCWIPQPGPAFPRIVAELIRETGATGNLIPDLQLAALAIEHGVGVCSADSDFGRFPGLSWTNPLA